MKKLSLYILLLFTIVACNLSNQNLYPSAQYKTVCVDDRFNNKYMRDIKRFFDKWSISIDVNYIMITFKVNFDQNGIFSYEKQPEFCDIYVLKSNPNNFVIKKNSQKPYKQIILVDPKI